MSDSPSSQNITESSSGRPLSGRLERAALLIAEDELSDRDIALEFGVARETVTRWRARPDVADRVAEIKRDIRAAIVAQGIANKQNRIDLIVEEHDLLERIRLERASHHETHDKDIPGVSTGLLVRTIKVVGVGRDQQVVEEWAIDNTLLSQRSALKRQAREETGQANDPVGSEGGVRIQIVGVDVNRVLGTSPANDHGGAV